MSTKKFVARHGLDANYNTISNVADPVNPGDVATKNVTDTIQSKTDSAFEAANTGISLAQSAFNSANNVAPQIEPAFNQANAAFAAANTGIDIAQGAFAAANNVAPQIEPAFNKANAAFAAANTKFSSSGGTVSGDVDITGSLVVEGNFTVSGNVTTVSANNLVLQDNMIYLNDDAQAVLNPDLGIAGAYNDGTYHHTGFFRDASDGVWKLFDNYSPEPDASPYIDTTHATFRIANFQANTITGSLFSGSGASLTNLPAGNLSGTIPSGVLGNSSLYVGTTAIALNRSSSSQTLTGVSIDGSAGSVAWGNVSSKPSTLSGYGITDWTSTGMPNNTDAYVNLRVVGNYNSSSSNDGMYIGYSNSNSGVTRIFGGGVTTGEFVKYASYSTEPGSFRAPLFYDSNNTGYYIDPASTSNINSMQMAGPLYMYSGSYEGSILFGSNSTWRCGIRQHDDADAELRIWAKNSSGMIFLTTGYDGEPASISRPTNGLVVQNNNVGIGNFSSSDPLYDLHIADGGIGYATGSFRAPIFYDSNNTGYYTELAGSTSINAAGLIIGSNINTYIKWLGTGISYDVDRTTKVSNGIAIYSAYSSGANNPWTYDISLQVNGNSRSFEISADWISSTSTGLKVRSLRDCCQNWSPWTDIATSGRSFTNSVDIRSPVFYDSSDTGYYINPNGDSRVSNLYSTAWFRNYGNQGIYNQDYGVHFYGQDSEGYCVTGSGGIVKLIFRSNHQSTVRGYVYGDTSNNFGFLNNGGSWRLRIVGGDYSLADGSSMRAQLYYDSNDTGYYCDPNSTSNMIRWTVRTTNTNLHSYGGSLGNEFIQWPGGTGCAGFSFHRSGYYAVNMALDNDNVIRIGGWSASANRLQMDMSGNLTMAGNVTAYSDIRLKENIKLIENPIEKIKQIRGVTFTRNDQDDKTKRHTGVIAQEVEVVLPEVISEDNEGVKNVAYGNMIGLLIEAIKEQQTQLEQQQETINKLKSLLNLE